VVSDAARIRLTTSKDPVIIGDAPSACSMHSHGQRAFADGCIDRKGLPHLNPSSLPAPRCRTQVIMEITRQPPRPASRAVPKLSAMHTRELIPQIASVEGGSSSEYDDSTDNANDYEDDSELQFSESESCPTKRLRH
ncbi:uncharacterized protein F5147DRAFT_587855, partial [Suillus discolor]